jgi:predicted cupin superfamily sugar epimerase
MVPPATDVIEALGLRPHPEGGWYVETWRAPAPTGSRPASSAIEAQVVVPSGAWQAARPLGAWTLVGCIVAPAFEFAGFELAPPGWDPPSA